jgi:hypothetical protein
MSKTEFDRLYGNEYQHDPHAKFFVASKVRTFTEKLTHELQHGKTSASFDCLEGANGKGYTQECLLYFILLELCGPRRARLEAADSRWQDKNFSFTVDKKITVSW